MCQSGPKVWLVLLVVGSFLFFVSQLFSGNFSGCIALKAYSYHVLSDALSLLVGLLSFLAHQSDTMANKDEEEDDLPLTNTYGWARIELVGSLISHVSIISLCFSCAVDSLQHLIAPDDGLHQHRRTMLAMGGLGIIVHLSVIFYSLIVRCCIGNSGASTSSRLSSSTPSRSAIETTPVSPCSSTLTKWDAFSAHTPIPSSGFNAFCLPFLHQCCLKNKAEVVVATNNGSKSAANNSAASIATSVSRYRLKTRSVRDQKRGYQIDYWAMLLHMGIGLLAAIMIVVDALVHFFVNHRDHSWVHYVDPTLALIIVGIIVANVTPLIVQSAFTLIQHIPDNIDVAALQKQLMKVSNVFQ